MTTAADDVQQAVEKMEIENDSKDALDDDSKNVAAGSNTEAANDDDLDNDISTTSDEDEAISPEKADELLMKATGYKEEGNHHFQAGEFDQAVRAYRRGCHALRPLNQNNLGDAQVQGLLTALQTNASMVLCKQKKYKKSAEMASAVLDRHPDHVKALFRRAVAYRHMGELDKAKADLRQALRHEPSNAAVKKELAAVKTDLDAYVGAQKLNLSRAFSKNGSLLYNDKEEAEKRKAQQEMEKKRAAQEAYKKRKQDWEDECVSRMAHGEPAIAFEDWEKEQDAKQKEEERLRKEEEKRKKKQQKENQKRDENDYEDELSEDEELLRGYKTTKDGRKTSYFTREVPDVVPISHVAPRRLDEANTVVPFPIKTGPSVWNQAGTWEEKDTTAWCTARLRKLLEDVHVFSSSQIDVVVAKVQDLSGHASIAMAAGKKRYIFEYEVSCLYEMQKSEEIVASGVVRLPDLCSTHHDEVEVTYDAWTKRPADEIEAMELRRELANALRAQVQRWVGDFNSQY